MRKSDTLPYAAIAAGLSISAIIAAVHLARLHPVPVVKAGALDVSAAAFWLFTSGLGVTSSSLSVKFFIFQMGFFGIVLVPPCWLALTLIISGYERFVNRRSILALSVMPLITLALVFTNGYHGLMYGGVELNPADPMLPLNLTPGLAFGFVVVAYSYALDGTGVVVLIKRLLVSRPSFRPQIHLLLAASLIPWLTNMLYLSAHDSFGYVEPTSLTLTVAGAIVMWRTAHWSGLYVAPIAHEVMVDNMNDPVIVLDYEKRVVDVNPMAERLIRRSHSELVGGPIEGAWPEWPRISKLMEDKTSSPKEISFDDGDMRRYYELEKSRLPGFTSEEVNLLITLRDITERKRIENARQESERRLRLVTDHMLDMVIRCDLRGIFEYVSPSHRQLGYEPKDLLGKSIFELIYPDDLERSVNAFLEGVQTRSPQRVELRFKHADGHYVWIESIGNPIFDQEGEVTGAIIGSRDVTERMQAEEALRESEDRLRRITDNMLDMVVETDLQGICKYASPSNRAILGYDPKDLVGKSLFDFVHPEDLAAVIETVGRAVSTGQLWTGGRYECRYRHADGHYVWLENLANIVRDHKGQMIGGVIGARDITERKRAEEVSSRLAAIVEFSDDAILGKTLGGVITSWNQGAAKLYGYSADEVEGRHVSILVPPDHVGELNQILERVGRGEPVERYETQRVRKDGTSIDVSLSVSPIKDSAGKIVGASTIARDVTERKRAEEALQRSEEKYRNLVENINDIVFSVDAAGHLTYVSPAVKRVLGYRVDELIGQPFSRFVVPDDLGILTSRFGRVLAGEVEPLEYRVLDKNGDVRYVQSSSRTQTEAGKVVGITGVLIDITERRRMQGELRKHTEHLEQLVEERTAELAMSERKYRLLVDNMADVVFTIDLEGNYTFCTPQAEKMTGYTVQQLLSMNMRELIAPEDLPRVLRSLEARTRSSTELSPIRFDIVRANGTRLPIEVKTSREVDGGKLVGVHGVARDITERKQIEDALRESEARFRELAELLPQPVLELDNEGKFTFANRAAFTLSGYTEQDMRRGINALDLVVPEDQERLAKTMIRIVSGEEAAGDEYAVVRRDGSTFPVFMHAVRVMRGSEFVGFRAIAVDITERKAAEEELQKLASVVKYSSELVNLATLDGKMIFLNEAGAKMLGIDSEEVQRVNIMQVIPDHLQEKVENEVLPALVSGGSWEGDLQYRNLKTGRLTDVHATTFTIKDPATGKPLYLANVSLDITERNKLEAQLAESQRLAAIGETTTMVGHDLRNPLQAMTGTLYLVKKFAMSEEVEDRKEAVGLLGRLDDAIRYMDKIVSDLQDYARPVGADSIQANLPDLVKAIVSNVKIPRGVNVSVDIQDGSSNVRLDPVLFRRVLTNLILNAVQSMPNGGRLTIAGSTTDGSLTVAVQDTGIGIAPENLAKIFNPFFTTKAQGQGLGLAVCKRLVEAQNGTITVKSEIGCGSTFTLKIPIN